MKDRDAYFDNAKFLLIALVVLGHALELLPQEAARAAWKFIYIFHMPAFVFITGYFSKKDGGKSVVTLLVLYGLLQAAYIAFRWFALHDIDEEMQFGFPLYAYWYLLACAVWRAFGPALARLRWVLPISVAVGLLAGYDDTLARSLTISRVIVLLPFFLLGMKTDRRHIDALKRLPWPVPAALLALMAAAVWLFMGDLPGDLFLHASSYEALALEQGFAYRLLLYALAFLTGAAFFALVPAGNTFFSRFGARTLPVYLLHPFAYAWLRFLRVGSWLVAPWQIALYLTGALALCFVLSLKPFGWIFRPVDWAVQKGMRDFPDRG